MLKCSVNRVRLGLLSSFCSWAQIKTSGISIFINNSASNKVICSAICSDLKSSNDACLKAKVYYTIGFKKICNTEELTGNTFDFLPQVRERIVIRPARRTFQILHSHDKRKFFTKFQQVPIILYLNYLSTFPSTPLNLKQPSNQNTRIDVLHS